MKKKRSEGREGEPGCCFVFVATATTKLLPKKESEGEPAGLRPRRTSTQRGLWGEEEGELGVPGPAHFWGQRPPSPAPSGAARQQKKDSSDQVQVKSSANNRSSLVRGRTLGTLPSPSTLTPTHPSSPPAALPPAAAGRARLQTSSSLAHPGNSCC